MWVRGRAGYIVAAVIVASVALSTPNAYPLAARRASTPTIVLDRTVGPPTSSVTVAGSGFGADTAVDLYFDTTVVALRIADANGDFAGAALTIPPDATPGTHWITAVSEATRTGAQQAYLVRSDWPELGYSHARSGTNPYENVLSPSTVPALTRYWTFDGSALINASVVVANGLVYFGGHFGGVFALNAATGRKVWTYPVVDTVSTAPAVANGLLYIITGTDFTTNVLALNASTGTLVWSYAIHHPQVDSLSAPAVANGIVYVGSNRRDLYALDAATGALRWSFRTGGRILGSPAVADGVVYVASWDRMLYALNAKTGRRRWAADIGTSESSPAVANGIVYIGSNDENVYAFKAEDGEPVWSRRTDGEVMSSPSVSNGTVYVGSSSGTVYALDATTGKVHWRERSPVTDDYVYSTPAVANGVVYIGSNGRRVYALDAATGALEWNYTNYLQFDSSPAVANGVIYVGSDKIYAFHLPHGPTSAARPDIATLAP